MKRAFSRWIVWEKLILGLPEQELGFEVRSLILLYGQCDTFCTCTRSPIQGCSAWDLGFHALIFLCHPSYQRKRITSTCLTSVDKFTLWKIWIYLTLVNNKRKSFKSLFLVKWRLGPKKVDLFLVAIIVSLSASKFTLSSSSDLLIYLLWGTRHLTLLFWASVSLYEGKWHSFNVVV